MSVEAKTNTAVDTVRARAGSPSYSELRERVRELVREWRAAGRFVPANDSWVRAFDPDFSRELGARGLLGISWPASVGGGGESFKARLAVTEELLRVGAPVSAHWIGERQVGPAVYRTGTSELQQEVLPGVLSGEIIFAIGMSEPEAGSDLASVRTSAKRVADGWILDGRKIWTTNAHRATHAYVLARTDASGPKHAGLSEFIVDIDTPGISISPIYDMSDRHHFNEVLFENTHVPTHRLLGEEGNGWRQVVEQLSFERSGPERVLSSYPLLTDLLATADESDSGVLEKVGQLTARLGALRRLVWQITDALDRNEAPVAEAATMKFLGTQFEGDVIEVARYAGLHRRESTALGYFEALIASPTFTIRGGALEVLLGIVAKQEARR